MIKKFFTALLTSSIFSLLIAHPLFAAPTYTIDQSHSAFNFAVKHLMVSTVHGGFTDFQGTIEFDPNDLNAFKADIEIKVDSIYTQLVERDKHLKSADFFDTEHFPFIIFKGAKIEKTDGGYAITGELTMRGTVKTVSIPVKITGPVKGLADKNVIGLEGELTVNRQDYGISWNKIADNGAIAGNEVKIGIDLEAHE